MIARFALITYFSGEQSDLFAREALPRLAGNSYVPHISVDARFFSCNMVLAKRPRAEMIPAFADFSTSNRADALAQLFDVNSFDHKSSRQ
jgi:hypothetical protein